MKSLKNEFFACFSGNFWCRVRPCFFTTQLTSGRNAVFSVIHLVFDSEKFFVSKLFVQLTELHPSEERVVDRSLDKNEISTKIQKIWNLSLFARQQQQGQTHTIDSSPSTWYQTEKISYPQKKWRLTITYYLYKKWKRTTKRASCKTSMPDSKSLFNKEKNKCQRYRSKWKLLRRNALKTAFQSKTAASRSYSSSNAYPQEVINRSGQLGSDDLLGQANIQKNST